MSKFELEDYLQKDSLACLKEMGGILGDMTIGDDGLLEFVLRGKRGQLYKVVEKDLKEFEKIKNFEIELGLSATVLLEILTKGYLFDKDGNRWTVDKNDSSAFYCYRFDEEGFSYTETFGFGEYKTDFFIKADRSE